jgi:hypothetical protein
VGAPERCPPVELCVIHRSDEINAEERALELPLVMIIGGTRLPIVTVELRRIIADHYGISADSFQVHHFHPEDFLVVFSFMGDMLRVWHDPAPPALALVLIFKRWHRQLRASAESLFYRVTVTI